MFLLEMERISGIKAKTDLARTGSAGWAIDRLILISNGYGHQNGDLNVGSYENGRDKILDQNTTNFLLLARNFDPYRKHHFLNTAYSYPASENRKSIFIADLESRWWYELTQGRKFRNTNRNKFIHPSGSMDYVFFHFDPFKTENINLLLDEAKRVLSKNGLIFIPTLTSWIPQSMRSIIPKSLRAPVFEELTYPGLKINLRAEVDDQIGHYSLIVYSHHESNIPAYPDLFYYSNR